MTQLSLEDLVIHHSQYDLAIFGYWRELLAPGFDLLLPTALGHLFLEKADGTVWFLDTWSGQLQQVAADYEAFRSLIGSDEAFQGFFLMPDLIEELRKAGVERGVGQCFTPFVSPGLGGSLRAANFTVTSLRVHLATSAGEYSSMHDQGVSIVK